MMEKKVIITGATSFIGRHLVKALLDKNWTIYAVVRKESREKLSGLSHKIIIVELDMNEYRMLSVRVGKPCEAYISLAWNGTRGQERLDAVKQEQNYIYSMDGLYEAIKLGCKTVISAGSQAEYGLMSGNTKVSEEMVCHPNTEYGKWKLRYYEEAYQFCEKRGVKFKEPRFFSLYGEDDYENTLILSTLRHMLNHEPCGLTKCIQMWDFLYIDDAVDGLLKLIEGRGSAGAYNFGSGDIRILKDFVMEMYQITGSRSKLLFGAIPYPDTGMVSIKPDIAKMQRETGWSAKTTFEAGIRKIMRSILSSKG